MSSRKLPNQTTAHPASRAGMSALALIVGSILWILVLGSLWLIATRESSSPAAPTNPESTSPSKDSGTADQIADPVPATTKTIKLSFPSRPLPDFTFPECQGGTLSLADLKGKRWLANFVFTRCQGPCPLMTRDISDLHRRVAKSAPDFLFVTFSVDSSYDSAEVLRKYAETFQADPSRWKFLTGDENAIHDLIRRGFSQYVQPNLGEMRKPGFEVAHSNRAVLVNEDGIPVGTWLMTIPEDVVKLRRVIEGRDEFPSPGPLLTEPSDGQNPPLNFNLVPANSGETKDASEAAPSTEPTAPTESSAPAETTAPQPPSESSNNENPSASTSRLAASLFHSLALRGLPPSTLLSSTLVPAPFPVPAARSTSQAQDPPPVAPTEPSSDPATTTGSAVPSRELSTSERNRVIDQTLPAWVRTLPTINALLNLLCTMLLIAGYIAIQGEPDEKAAKKVLHRNLMTAAFAVSVVFLACYLTYHEALYRWSGQRGREFVGSDFARILYYSILIPHVILAAFVPFLALRVFYLAWKERWERHRKLARITLPIWLFVSITGVLVYAMLYHWPWSTLEPVVVEPGTAV